MPSSPDFAGVTELAGDPASREQIERLYRRYYWAGRYVRGADVLEVACGAGQGLGFLASVANSVRAGDVSEVVLETARRHYGERIELGRLDAEQLPYPDAMFDVVIMFEAIYYVRHVNRFLREARRVLRPGGYLLIATANKDLFDFTPSPHSVDYYGIPELEMMLREAGFSASFFGDTPLAAVSLWQRLLRPVKLVANVTGIMPKSKRMKEILKRVVFGPIRPLPAEIAAGAEVGPDPTPLVAALRNTEYKVIFCEARCGF